MMNSAGRTAAMPISMMSLPLSNALASKPDFEPHVVTDGLLVTGQNPASSTEAANALLRLLS